MRLRAVGPDRGRDADLVGQVPGHRVAVAARVVPAASAVLEPRKHQFGHPSCGTWPDLRPARRHLGG